ncbi:MAG: hypothetical protein BWY76_00998 [bacterium ADurb.Bin429]|nr:MAG: hypothetical protein BWY76_00998 [bacterium ADurb.Bin429]
MTKTGPSSTTHTFADRHLCGVSNQPRPPHVPPRWRTAARYEGTFSAGMGGSKVFSIRLKRAPVSVVVTSSVPPFRATRRSLPAAGFPGVSVKARVSSARRVVTSHSVAAFSEPSG